MTRFASVRFAITILFTLVAIHVLFPIHSLLGSDDGKVDTLVVCPKSFHAALQEWVDYRQKQGHKIRVIEPTLTPVGLKKAIAEQAKKGDLKNLVLVGDCREDRDQKNRGALVPTDYVKAKVNVRYGAVPDIATDNAFADLDGDGSPELTVGRIPADSAKQLTQIIRKVIAYEKKMPNSLWRRKINFIAGVGGFGVVEDKVIENATKKLITEMVPSDFETTVTYASWNSPYCPDPRQFSTTTIERLNEGCLFWVYIGHGHYKYLDYVNFPGKSYKIFDVNQADQVKSRAGMPIAIFLACNTCGFDQPSDCIGEELLKQPNGPVAVLGGSRITMPYGMSVMSLDLMKDFFSQKQLTLGELVRLAKSHLVKDDGHKGEFREMLDALGKVFSPTAHLMNDERKEHAQLIHLLGDPLLRIAKPEAIKVTADEKATSGEKLSVRFESPIAGKATIELAYRRDRLTFRPKHRRYGVFSDEEMKALQVTYKKANQLVRASKTIDLNQAGEASIDLEIPPEVRGDCVIRVYVANDEKFASGAREIRMKKAN